MLHRVALLCLEPLVGFDMSIAPQVFGSARDAEGQALYEVQVCGLRAGASVATTKGYDIVTPFGPEALATADTVLIPGTYYPAARDGGVLGQELAAAWTLIRPGARVMSICTGAFVLAAAGLLNGRRATTHWEHVENFRRTFPQVELDPDVLFVDEGSVLTSAGLGAGIDLCLHVIRRDFGIQAANHAARACVVPPHREGGQAQFIEHPLPPDADASTAQTRDWAQGNIKAVSRVEDMVSHARMSQRTFSRRFRSETGLSPQQWLLQARMQRALELLEHSTLPIDRVAEEAGFGTAAALRQRMRFALAISPQNYRKTFQGA